MADRGARADVPDTSGLGELGPDGVVIYERLLPAVVGSVPRIRRELGAVLVQDALDARRRSDIALFVTEAASNAVRHAYSGEPGLVYALAGLDEDWLGVVISDWGCGLPTTRPAGAGLGLRLMDRLADAVTIDSDGSGTDVEGSFRLADRPSGPSAEPREAGGQMLGEYLRVLQETNAGLRQETAGVLAEAQQAVAHSRRRRLARHRLH